MLKGCEFAPKTTGVFALWDKQHVITATCAIGAAAHGILGREASGVEVSHKAFGIQQEIGDDLYCEIANWNDNLDGDPVPREEIAARLAERGL